MSKDKKTIYIDKRIPKFLDINGKKMNVHVYPGNVALQAKKP
jgi:hypothetical protein